MESFLLFENGDEAPLPGPLDFIGSMNIGAFHPLGRSTASLFECSGATFSVAATENLCFFVSFLSVLLCGLFVGVTVDCCNFLEDISTLPIDRFSMAKSCERVL